MVSLDLLWISVWCLNLYTGAKVVDEREGMEQRVCVSFLPLTMHTTYGLEELKFTCSAPKTQRLSHLAPILAPTSSVLAAWRCWGMRILHSIASLFDSTVSSWRNVDTLNICAREINRCCVLKSALPWYVFSSLWYRYRLTILQTLVNAPEWES